MPRQNTKLHFLLSSWHIIALFCCCTCSAPPPQFTLLQSAAQSTLFEEVKTLHVSKSPSAPQSRRTPICAEALSTSSINKNGSKKCVQCFRAIFGCKARPVVFWWGTGVLRAPACVSQPCECVRYVLVVLIAD